MKLIMRRIKLLFFALFSFSKIFSQEISIANEMMNIFYVGCSNPITIAVENFRLADLTLKTTNGDLLLEDEQYSFRPHKIGLAEIIIYKTEQSKLVEIGRKQFRAKRLPEPTFSIGPGGSLIPKNTIVSQIYVRAERDGTCGCGGVRIKEFKLKIIYRCKNEIVEFKNVGNKISNEIRQAFEILESGDILVFEDVILEGYGFDGMILRQNLIRVQ